MTGRKNRSSARQCVLSIGSSCINRFQINFLLGRRSELAPAFPRALFDWNISSLNSTIGLLRHAADGTLQDVLADDTLYRLNDQGLIIHEDFPEFLFFHEENPELLLQDNALRRNFLEKVAHLEKPFSFPAKSMPYHLIWSNIQPNLRDATKGIIPWEAFRLNASRREEILDHGRRIFGEDTRFTFISREEDLDDNLSSQPDVLVRDLPRGPEWEGEPMLFDDPLNRALENLPHRRTTKLRVLTNWLIGAPRGS